MNELLYKEEVFEIIGAAIEVHRELGNGFLEPVYQESLQIELDLRKIPFAPQQRLHLFYKRHRVEKRIYSRFHLL